MIKFNINHYMYIQITEKGWTYLQRTVGQSYIDACITSSKVVINNEDWYRLQCHHVFEVLPISFGMPQLFNSNVMFDKT